jgi:exopolysaccharide biosynthesis polyprenyl glycosylphosphotransferase
MAIRADRVLDLQRERSTRAPRTARPLAISAAKPGTARVVRTPVPKLGHSWIRIGLIAGDASATMVAWVLVLLLWGPGRRHAVELVLLAIGGCLVNAQRMGLYRGRVSSARADELRHVATLSVRIPATVLVVCYVARWKVPVALFVGVIPAMYVLIAAVRGFVDSMLRGLRRQDRFCRQELVVGDIEEAAHLCEKFVEHPDVGRRIIGVISDKSAGNDELSGAPWLGQVRNALALADATPATGVFLTTNGIDVATRRSLIEGFHARGLYVHMSPALLGFSSHNVQQAPMLHEPMLMIAPSASPRWALATKRVFDVVVAAILLVLTAPLVAASAVAIKLTSKGPILFRQNRVGKDGVIFNVLKLRTMEVDAEARLKDLAATNERNGPLFKSACDPRVTSIGKLLRASSIDELPQLINVLRGEMSLVGPRPALPQEVAQFDTELTARHNVRPGITGLWQVESRDSAAFGPYRRLDLLYARHWSLGLDIVILVMTVQTVIARIVDIGWRVSRTALTRTTRRARAPEVSCPNG